MSEARVAACGADGATSPQSHAAQQPKPVRPRLAASMVLIDRSGSEPKVLLGRRNAKLAFLPGKYVFPGGRLETADRLMQAVGTLPAICRKKLAQRRPRGFPGPEAFALAAIRETFEETGLLFGTKGQPPQGSVPAAWQAYAALGFTPDLGPLQFIARAITPPAFPYRYDTSFFALDSTAVAHRIENCVNEEAELVELAWLSLADAGQCDIPKITAMILGELQLRITAGFLADLPVPFFYERQQRWIREEL
jgi:8-oxo-dGTP pyrophosphatase MutT (NUDIX family)